MEGKIQTQKRGFPDNFASKNIGILHISYPKIWGKNCVSHKFVGKRLFLRYYRIESSKNTVAETFYPPKLGSSYCKS